MTALIIALGVVAHMIFLVNFSKAGSNYGHKTWSLYIATMASLVYVIWFWLWVAGV